MTARRLTYPALLLAFTLFSCETPSPQEASATTEEIETISVLLVSGQNNHDWQETNEFLLDIMDDTDLFEASVSLTPPRGAEEGVWDNWNPDFSQYDVVLIDYNGEMWPEGVMSHFETYIAGGGSAFAIHASNNPFPGWEAYEQMVGLLWRDEDTGYRVYMDEDGSIIRQAPGEGIGAGHGERHDWQIRTRDADHPIMQGTPEVWLHPFDELYHGQRGPAENMNILATAYSDPDTGGTGLHELMIWWIPYGEGKVLTFLPGHHWPEQEDTQAFRCVGFRTLLSRSLEWLATGTVTIPVPDDFPTANEISVVD